MAGVQLVKATLEEVIKINKAVVNGKTPFPTIDMLKFVGMVSVIGNMYNTPLVELNNNLKHEAESLGASYVFGVTYCFASGISPAGLGINGKTIAYGDAYKLPSGGGGSNI